MKSLLLFIIFTTISLFLYSQGRLLDVIPLKDGNAFYSGTVTVDSVSQKELFLRAKRWFVFTFADIKGATIQYEEPENGILRAKGAVAVYVITFLGGASKSIWFTIQINTAANKCRYEIQKILHLSDDHSYFTPIENYDGSSKINKEFGSAIDGGIKTRIQSLKEALDPDRTEEISSSLKNFIAFYKSKDSVSALKAIKDAYTKYPEDMRILLPLIDYYNAIVRTNEVMVYIDKAIAIENDNPLLYIKKGKAFLNLGKDQEAINEFKNAIQLKSNDMLVYFHIGMAYRDRAIQKIEEKKKPYEDLVQTLYYWEEGLKIDKSEKNMKAKISMLKDDIKKYKE